MILSHSLRTVFLLKMDFFFWRELLIGSFHTQENMWEHPYPALWLLRWNHFCSLGSCRIMTLNHPPVFQSSRSTELSLWPHRCLLPVHSVLPILFPTTCAVNDDVVRRVLFLPPALWTMVPKPHRHALFLSKPHPKLSTLFTRFWWLNSAHLDSVCVFSFLPLLRIGLKACFTLLFYNFSFCLVWQYLQLIILKT